MAYRIVSFSRIYGSIVDENGNKVADINTGGRGSGWHIYSPNGDKYLGNARWKKDVIPVFLEARKKTKK
jgi:hypothetical protein